MSTSAFNSASFGIQRNLRSLDLAASHIANRPVDAETIRDVFEMKRAKQGVSASALVLRVSDEMTGQLIDLLA